MHLLKSWGFMQVLRFVFGVVVMIQAIITLDMVLGIMGLVVGGMAFLNLGCCGANGCEANDKNSNPKNQISDVEYEEVVIK